MMTTYFGRGYTRKTACRIYHPPESIVNQTGPIFKLDLCACHHTKLAGLTCLENSSGPGERRRTIVVVGSDRKPLFDEFGLCYYRDYGRDHH